MGRRSEPELTSTSTDLSDNLPPLASLQAWVHRPQAIARCFITDVLELRALVHRDDEISLCSRDVFLLDRFPCKIVEIVAWVAGVAHKQSTMTITLDEGNGTCVLEAAVRLTQLDISRTTNAASRGGTYRTAKQRKETVIVPSVDAKFFVRPDIRVGDTVRVVGRVDEWLRGKETIRQLFVDVAGGVGSIAVVDPHEEFFHYDEVCFLHETLYSRTFVMPPAATPAPSPSKSILSSVSSEYGDEEEDFEELPDPAKLSASRLTEATFKLYLLDHMTRETATTMKTLYGRVLPFEPIPNLQQLFPEYMGVDPPSSRPPDVFGTNQFDNRLKATTFDTTVGVDDATPRACVFRSKTERQLRSKLLPPPIDDTTPMGRTFRSRAERERLMAESMAPGLEYPQALTVFTIPVLLATPKLRNLAARIVDARARHEEKLRRHRAKHGTPTARDLRVVADRIARGLDAGSYKLAPPERERKMVGLVEWAIRKAHAEGGLVQVETQPKEISAPGVPSWRTSSGITGYLPLPPELLAPLLVPIVNAATLSQRGTFRSRLERMARDSRDGSKNGPAVDASAVVARLRSWGEDGRWERVGLWAVEAALEWGEAHGILSL